MVYSTSQLITIVADFGSADSGGAITANGSFVCSLVYCCMGRCFMRKIVVLFHNRFGLDVICCFVCYAKLVIHVEMTKGMGKFFEGVRKC